VRETRALHRLRRPVGMVVIGCSSGGLVALEQVLGPLPASFPAPIAIVQHIGPKGPGVAASLERSVRLSVKEADEKEASEPGRIYLAPPDYHLLVEPNGSFSLSVDPRVNFCRPAIDVLFESAVDGFGDRLIGVLLTGNNADGAHGLLKIRQAGGMTLVEDPETAAFPSMPRAAVALGAAERVLSLGEIAQALQDEVVRHDGE